MKEFEIWRRCDAFNRIDPLALAGRRVYVPPIEPMGNLPYELAGLLPNREHSRDLMTLIDSLPENNAGNRAVVGLFAADPFLNCKRIADRLIAKGYRQVANIPPVGAYGSEFLATLDKVSAGQAQEQRNIDQLLNRGLSVSAAVASIDHLPAALAWSPHHLWVVPSFDMWKGAAIDADLLLDLCKATTGRTDVPVVLITSRTGLSVRDAAGAGARGILRDED